MGARLLPIALDFFAPTFIAGTGHPPPLLHGKRGLDLLGVRCSILGGEVLGDIVGRSARKFALVLKIGGRVW
jgi:hypothetical protein